jgi:uncharacterized repeat protein (TIGR03803 family)
MKTALRAEYLPRALKLCRKPVIATPRGSSNKWSPQSSTCSALSLLMVVATGFLVAFSGDGQAQVVASFRTLYSFTNGTDGESPEAGLVLSGTKLYGTAPGGGATGNGTVFSINTDGSDFRVLYAFSASSIDQAELEPNFDGSEPRGGVVLAGNTL